MPSVEHVVDPRQYALLHTLVRVLLARLGGTVSLSAAEFDVLPPDDNLYITNREFPVTLSDKPI